MANDTVSPHQRKAPVVIPYPTRRLTSLHAKEVPPHKPLTQHRATPTHPTPPSIHWSPTTIDTHRWRAAARLVEQECETLAMTLAKTLNGEIHLQWQVRGIV